jgi:hypothetical protein
MADKNDAIIKELKDYLSSVSDKEFNDVMYSVERKRAGRRTKLDNMFYNKLKTYKAKDLHPDCEVVKKKKLAMAIKEINNALYNCRWDLNRIKDAVNRSLSDLLG